MVETICVDFHCHSLHSDGVMTVRELADYLAESAVLAAALADHNTLEGYEEFRAALARYEISTIPAVEITTWYQGKEAHLLAYNVNPSNIELQSALAELRHYNSHTNQSVADSLRSKNPTFLHESASLLQEGRLDIIQAIALVHRAGGYAFLAHPLLFEANYQQLESLLVALKNAGLDGIEAIYANFDEEEQQVLCDIAQRNGLLVSAGSDVHKKSAPPAMAGMEMPVPLWKQFRDAVIGAAAQVPPVGRKVVRQPSRIKWRPLLFHFIVPSLLAIALFIIALYAIILPTFERSLMERKREMIRELTNSAWSILAGYERDERAGTLNRTEAQQMAISRIASLRYGHDNKDYFWLQDMTPRIIMHPYRKDLNGKDVSTFRDPRGVAIFVEFVQVVRRDKEGFASYVWQWNDDPNRLVPKESYVKEFQPWGWIIGTGIYVEDVRAEIKRIEHSLVRTIFIISIIVILLLLYVVYEGLSLERERAEGEESLCESNERYRSLVEATSEGMLLVMEGRFRYANPIILDMIGSQSAGMEMLDLADLFPESAENDLAWQQLRRLLDGEEVAAGFDAVLQRRDGKLLDCVITPSRIVIGERQGFILLLRSIDIPSGNAADADGEWRPMRDFFAGSPLGIFRARIEGRGALTASNQTALQLLSVKEKLEDSQIVLAELFADAQQYEEFRQELQQHNHATWQIDLGITGLNRRVIRMVAHLQRAITGDAIAVHGVVADVTQLAEREDEQLAEIARLHSSLLFLHQPISHLQGVMLSCNLESPIGTVAQQMTEQAVGAALVQTAAGEALGIITDSDIRQRVVAVGLDNRLPVRQVMTAPLITISENAVIYQALLLMEQRNIQHLAVVNDAGRAVGIIHHQELLQFRNYGPIVLAREVKNAAGPEEVVRNCQRVPGLARAMLASGAPAQLISSMISTICNTATERLIVLAEAEFGPAPVQFVFIALGSQGRQEMTLTSDQDNAIVYLLDDEEKREAAEAYLLKLGSYVCNWLDRAGYPLCKGEIMAKNPRWCQPLEVWKKYFRDWITRAEPQQLLEFSIFFDFSPLYGAQEIARELRAYVFAQANANQSFFPHFAANALLFKPPARLFGRFIGSNGEQSGVLDLKDALMPIVSFARLYALCGQLDVNHTEERLVALTEATILPEISSREIIESYQFLMRLRLQAALLSASSNPVNSINVRKLSQMEQALLRQSFDQISAIQKRISYDFLGGTQ